MVPLKVLKQLYVVGCLDKNLSDIANQTSIKGEFFLGVSLLQLSDDGQHLLHSFPYRDRRGVRNLIMIRLPNRISKHCNFSQPNTASRRSHLLPKASCPLEPSPAKF